MNQLPYLPTEITDLIYDFKHAMEMKEHNNYHKDLLNDFKDKVNTFNCIRNGIEFTDYYFEEVIDRITNDEYDALYISSDEESDDDY